MTTPFKAAPPKVEKWLYCDWYTGTSKIYDDSSINYIIMGHTFAHLRLGYAQSRIVLEFYSRRLRHGAHHPVTPEVWFWFKKGYREHDFRDHW